MKNRRIDFVIPVFNEEKSIARTIHDLLRQIGKAEYEFKIIMINDGSTDGSLSKIKEISKTHKNISWINFSRNFGKEVALSAGLHSSSANAVVMLDADGQHPVELIPKFIGLWEQGYKIVTGVRTASAGGKFREKTSSIFGKVLGLVTGNKSYSKHAYTDFRLLDRQVVTEFKKLKEHNRITRGLIDWLGFKSTIIEFHPNQRTGGKPTYTTRKLLRLALHAFVSQSTRPLKLVGMLGVVVCMISFALGIFIIVESVLFENSLNISGTATLAVFLSFLVGVVLVCQGLLALYVESIFTESQDRPLYIIESSSNSKE